MNDCKTCGKPQIEMETNESDYDIEPDAIEDLTIYCHEGLESMRVTIEFETDNTAFSDDFTAELNHVLYSAEMKIWAQRRRKPATVCTALESIDKLLDTNGNTIGTVRIEKQRIGAKRKRCDE